MHEALFPGEVVLLVLSGYLLLLFGIGYIAEKRYADLRARGFDRYIYVLAAGVYCTSWTFYGCIGNVAQSGISFLGLFIGPSVMAFGWWFGLRKLVKVCRARNITSVPDFLSVRYGKSGWIGPLATLLLVVGSIPYLSLQLRAVAISFDMIAGPGSAPGAFRLLDPMLLVSLFLGAFALFFGGRYLDFTKPQGGLLTAVAVESVVKIVIFLAAGVFVCYGVFDGPGEIFARIQARPEWRELATIRGPSGTGHARFAAYILIAVVDVLLLPRQFHVLVVQNGDERHIKTAMWMFPLYLLLINLFVVPIALGGVLLGLPPGEGDKYILSIPMRHGPALLSLAVFLGGFSAATAMVMVSSVALGKMVANNLIIPVILRLRRGFHDYGWLLLSARLSMIVVIALGYLYARLMSLNMVLMEIGIISFVAVAQFGPPVFGGLYWKGASRGGAVVGLCTGFAAWFYTLIVPAAVKAGFIGGALLAEGPFGIASLRPIQILGIPFLDPVANAVFWSLSLNTLGFVVGSYLLAPSWEEAEEAAELVAGEEQARRAAPDAENRPIGRGAHYLSLEEVEGVVTRYAGREKEKEIEAVVREIREIKRKGQTREAVIRQIDLPQRLERILMGSVGAIAARNILRDMLPLSLDEARALAASLRAMEKDLESKREEVSHKDEEIRARERFLASVVRSIDDGIVAFDFDGRITAANEGAARLFQRNETEFIGSDFNVLIRDTSYRERRRIIARATYRTGRWKGEVEIVRKDGTTAPALLSTAKIIDDRGRPIGFVCSFKDLTEIKDMQSKMIQTEKLASLGQMAAGVAHEIRNPLGSIKMSARLLQGPSEGTDVQEIVETIREAVGSMEVIVNELLDYTREIILQVDEYDIGGIVRGAVVGLEDEYRPKGVGVVVEDGGGCLAQVDGVRLKQVVGNIVRNAVDAAPPGEGRVVVAVSGTDGTIRIVVEDNGPGMDPGELEKVFQPFYTTKAQGVGLGMPIVKRLVEMHGGSVRVASREGRGTTVTVTLPRYLFGAAGAAR